MADAPLASPWRNASAEPLLCQSHKRLRTEQGKIDSISPSQWRQQPKKRFQISRKRWVRVVQTIHKHILEDTVDANSRRRNRCMDALSEPAISLGLQCGSVWRTVKTLYFKQRDRDQEALIAAVAAVTVGLSLSLADTAIAESLSEISIARSSGPFVEADHVLDRIKAQLNPELRVGLQAELPTYRMMKDEAHPRNSEEELHPITVHAEDNLVGIHETDGLNLREDESGAISLSLEKVSPSLKETAELREIPGAISLSLEKVSPSLKGTAELRDGRGRDRDTSLVQATPVLIPANCAPSDLVAVATVGSSLASAAGRAVSQSGASLQQVVALPGEQLLARVLQHLGGGGVAGAVGASVVYPLDTIKTRMQAQSSKDGEEPQYKDELDCFRQLLDEEGPGSLYSGLVPQLLGIAPEKALKLTVNEILLQMLEQLLPGARLWALEFIAGGGGGFSQVVVTNPMEIVKVRLQMQSKEVSPKGLWQVVKELGFQGLYCGSGITIARDVPSSAVFFACYTLLRQLYPDQSFWAGFLAAIPATVLVTPLDVIKTRLQMETPPGEEPYRDAWHCFRVLLEREGPGALFKGGLMRVLRTSPQFGITLMLYSLFCNAS